MSFFILMKSVCYISLYILLPAFGAYAVHDTVRSLQEESKDEQ